MTVVNIPGSKSITVRALFLAAAAAGASVLRRPLVSDDTEAFAMALTQFGYSVASSADNWSVTGTGNGPSVGDADVYCRDSATTARFLPALAATGRGSFRFDASAQMRRRPLGPLVSALRDLGVEVRHEDQPDHLPIRLVGRGIDGGYLRMDAGLSSQFLTAVLLAAPLMAKGLTVEVAQLVSAPYVEMTIAMMRSFGVDVEREDGTLYVPAQRYQAIDYAVEPDASTASYFLAAAVTGNSVTIPGLGAQSLQGDIRFADILARMGADVQLTANAVTATGTGRLRGITMDMRDISDTMPTLAAIAPFADAPVRIENVYNTRVKECDRLDVSASNLRRLGIQVETGRDWIQIWPGLPTGAEISCHGDHRIAMAFSITGLNVPGITLDDPACVKKTFPKFHQELAALRRAWH